MFGEPAVMPCLHLAQRDQESGEVYAARDSLLTDAKSPADKENDTFRFGRGSSTIAPQRATQDSGRLRLTTPGRGQTLQ